MLTASVYQIVDYFHYGPNDVYYDPNSALDMLEKNKYLSPAQRQQLTERWGEVEIKFGSDIKSAQKLVSQMNQRGWTESTVRSTVNNPYTTRASMNKGTGNTATVYYTESGSYIIIDDITNEIVQIGDNINPSNWIPDSSIINPYQP